MLFAPSSFHEIDSDTAAPDDAQILDDYGLVCGHDMLHSYAIDVTNHCSMTSPRAVSFLQQRISEQRDFHCARNALTNDAYTKSERMV